MSRAIGELKLAWCLAFETNHYEVLILAYVALQEPARRKLAGQVGLADLLQAYRRAATRKRNDGLDEQSDQTVTSSG